MNKNHTETIVFEAYKKTGDSLLNSQVTLREYGH